jgi:transposase
MVLNECYLCWERELKKSSKCLYCRVKKTVEELSPSYGCCQECCFKIGYDYNSQTHCLNCRSRLLALYQKEHNGFCRGCILSKRSED